MKILVLSLLRLGDIIQQVPLLRGLRAQYPNAEIHLLVNRQFVQVERILGDVVDKFYYFDREALQKGLGEAEYNILWSYTQVENLIQRLNQESYDSAYNFTHNKLSAYLLGALEIQNKKGLSYADDRFQGLSNRWLRYFNERFSGTQKSLFHYVELLANAFGIPQAQEGELLEIQKPKSKLVLLQCLTSDEKKNWGLENFAQLKRTIEISLVDYEVCVLGAPFERERLLQYFSESDLLICDLVEARKHLQNAAVLVSGDTSIKHLAAQVGTPIVEIAIGSSDAAKTGAYSAKAVILSSSAECAPCSHSQGCSQKSHLCAEDVTVEKVYAAVWDQLSGEKIEAQNIYKALDRAVWSLYLDKETADFEKVYYRVLTAVLNQYGNEKIQKAMPEWLEQSEKFRHWNEKARQALPERKTLADKKNFQSSDIADLILCAQEILKSKKDTSGYFQVFLESLMSRFANPVQIFDRVSLALNEVEELLNIRDAFTRRMQNLSMEGVYYAKGIGQLSVDGFEETRESLQRNSEDSGLQSRSRENTAP